MVSDKNADKNEIADAIRKLHVHRGEAYGRGDVEGYLSHYADDASMFVLNEAMTKQKLAEEVRSLFARGAQVIALNIPHDVKVRLSDSADAAVMSFAWQEKFQNPDGTITDSSFFETDVWYRKNDRWEIVSLHFTALEV